MDYASKKFALFILGLTAIVCSRLMFIFFNDPEGPNLLVVGVCATAVYLVSLAAYFYTPANITAIKKLSLVILIQVALVTGLYFTLN
jgi:hypothetical protein